VSSFSRSRVWESFRPAAASIWKPESVWARPISAPSSGSWRGSWAPQRPRVQERAQASKETFEAPFLSKDGVSRVVENIQFRRGGINSQARKIPLIKCASFRRKAAILIVGDQHARRGPNDYR